jgi:hypothetical protein
VSQDTFNTVCNFFTQLGESGATQKELARYDQTIQFHIDDESPFCIRIAGGKISPEVGRATDKIESVDDFLGLLLLKADAETIAGLMAGSITLGETLLNGKVDIYGNIQKEYIIAWLSRLFRRIAR